MDHGLAPQRPGLGRPGEVGTSGEIGLVLCYAVCYVHIAEATGTRRLHPRVGALCGSRSISVRSSGSFPRLVTFTLAGANQTVAMDFLAVQIAAPPGVPRAKPVLCGSGRVYDCTTTRVGRIHSLSSSWKPKSHQRLSTSSSESFSLPKC